MVVLSHSASPEDDLSDLQTSYWLGNKPLNSCLQLWYLTFVDLFSTPLDNLDNP